MEFFTGFEFLTFSLNYISTGDYSTVPIPKKDEFSIVSTITQKQALLEVLIQEVMPNKNKLFWGSELVTRC